MIGSPLSKLFLFVLLIWLCSNSYAAEVRISNFLLVGRGVTEIARDFIEMKEKVENLTTLRSNKEAFKDKLREIGFFQDLSDAYVTQHVSPRYQIP